jgi:hypothetical protein
MIEATWIFSTGNARFALWSRQASETCRQPTLRKTATKVDRQCGSNAKIMAPKHMLTLAATP